MRKTTRKAGEFLCRAGPGPADVGADETWDTTRLQDS